MIGLLASGANVFLVAKNGTEQPWVKIENFDIWNVFQFHFWPPRRHWRHLYMILSYQEDCYGCLDTLNVKIRLLVQIL